MPKGATFCLAVLLVLASAACDESKSPVVVDIGVTRIFFVDSGIETQDLTETTRQVAKWAVRVADVSLADTTLDLTLGQICTFDDTIRIFSEATGKCAGGLIIGSNEQPVTLQLTLDFTMQVRRAVPLDLPPADDYDGDSLPNGSDNCPLIDNPDQQDSDRSGVGDACSVTTGTGATAADNDGDGLADFADNCIWIQNPDQEDTRGLSAKGTPDGIGDACDDQQAIGIAAGTGSTDFQIVLEIEEFVQRRDAQTYLTVDFGGPVTVLCDWSSNPSALSTCTVDTGLIDVCVQSTFIAAGLGCGEF